MRNIIFLFVCLLFFLSCKQDQTNGSNQEHTGKHEEKSQSTTISKEDLEKMPLYDRVIAIHDIAMPKMKDIELSQQAVRMKIDSIETLNIHPEQKPKFKKALGELNRSHDMMMDWMNQFSKNYDSTKTKESQEIKLRIELEKIKAVNNQIDRSIKGANEVLSGSSLK